MTISGKKVSHKSDTLVDPRLFTPPNVLGLISGADEELTDEFGAGVEDEDAIEIVDWDYTGDDGNELPIPTGIKVVQQIVKIAANGTMSVDVVLEVEGADKYQVDVRMSDSTGVRQ